MLQCIYKLINNKNKTMKKAEIIKKLNEKIDQCIIDGNWKEFNRLTKLHKEITK